MALTKGDLKAIEGITKGIVEDTLDKRLGKTFSNGTPLDEYLATQFTDIRGWFYALCKSCRINSDETRRRVTENKERIDKLDPTERPFIQ